MDLWQQLVLQSVGPLVTAVVGTLIIGTFVAQVTRKAQERRADSELHEQRIRTQNELRFKLVDQMTETASGLYMATQNYWRKKDVEHVSKEELALNQKELDQQYRTSRVLGEVIERRLEAYFSSKNSKELWHATTDLLTVRYFYLIGLATEGLLERNSGEEHTGLSVEELRDQRLVLTTYREKLITGAQAVLRDRFRDFAV